MTLRAPAQGDQGRRPPGPSHPLQRLGADEIRLARTVLADQGLVSEHTRFAYLGLEEPPKPEVLAFRPGEPVERRVRAILLDTATGDATDVVAPSPVERSTPRSCSTPPATGSRRSCSRT